MEKSVGAFGRYCSITPPRRGTLRKKLCYAGEAFCAGWYDVWIDDQTLPDHLRNDIVEAVYDVLITIITN